MYVDVDVAAIVIVWCPFFLLLSFSAIRTWLGIASDEGVSGCDDCLSHISVMSCIQRVLPHTHMSLCRWVLTWLVKQSNEFSSLTCSLRVFLLGIDRWLDWSGERRKFADSTNLIYRCSPSYST